MDNSFLVVSFSIQNKAFTIWWLFFIHIVYTNRLNASTTTWEGDSISFSIYAYLYFYFSVYLSSLVFSQYHTGKLHFNFKAMHWNKHSENNDSTQKKRKNYSNQRHMNIFFFVSTAHFERNIKSWTSTWNMCHVSKVSICTLCKLFFFLFRAKAQFWLRMKLKLSFC